MKTIQIPTTSNPFIVSINNQVYTYKAGSTVEVPDEVAAAIEDALDLEPKPKRYLNKIAQLAEGSLTELTSGDLDGVKTIVSSAFSYCRSLTSLDIPDSVTSIDTSAFYNCGELKCVRFGDNSKIESIGGSVFDWCAKLASVYLPKTPPTLANISAFTNIKAGCVFYCKTQASLEAYKAAANWSTLTGTYTFTVEA